MIMAYRSKAEAIRASFGPWSYICSGYTLLGPPRSNKRRLWSALYLSGDLQNGRWRSRTSRRPGGSMLGGMIGGRDNVPGIVLEWYKWLEQKLRIPRPDRSRNGRG